MTPRLLLPLFMLLAGAQAARAQDAGADEEDAAADVTIDPKNLLLTVDGALENIGVATCEAETAKTLDIKGKLDVNEEADDGFRLRLFLTTDEDCSEDDFSTCDRSPPAGKACRCLAEGSADGKTVSAQTSLAAAFPADPCAPDTETSVRITLIYYVPGADGASPEIVKAEFNAEYLIDLKAPGRMTASPLIRVGENSLGISRGSARASDAETYEVCYGAAALLGDEQLAALCSDTRSGAEAARVVTVANVTCDDAGTWDGEFDTSRGLENNVEYIVTSRAIDRAENPGPYGPCARATPVPVEDFAEYYERLNGSETGGCSMGRGSFGGGPAAVIGACVALFALGRRRSR